MALHQIMNYQLHYIKPTFLADKEEMAGDIWNTDLQLESGKRYLIRASSGKGKSSIIGYLFGTRNNYQGTISFNAERLEEMTNQRWSELRQQNLACMFQELRLFDMLTVKENLQIKLNMQSRYSIAEATSWLDELGMSGFLDRPVNTLSLGQQQRVALVRTLLQPMEWLLLDEPFSHLDEKNIESCKELILRICNAQNTGIVITTLGETYGFPYDQILEL
jgi:putative ABC transport system ATP-binding protein